MAADKMDARLKIKQIDTELLALVKARGELVKQVAASDWQVAKKLISQD
jgi:chorismate mutase